MAYGVRRFMPSIQERSISDKTPTEETMYATSIDRASALKRMATEFLIKEHENLRLNTAIIYA